MIENVTTEQIENKISMYKNMLQNPGQTSVLMQHEAVVMMDVLKAELLRRQQDEAIEVMAEHILPYLDKLMITLKQCGVGSIEFYNDGSGGVRRDYDDTYCASWDYVASGAKALAKLCVRNETNVRNAD